MFSITDSIIAFLISLVTTLILVYPIKKLAIKIGAMDLPNYRKIHIDPTPRLGGLAIFLGVAISLLYLRPEHDQLLEICIGAVIIIITGVLDDKYQIRPTIKLSGQLLAALVLVSGGVIIERITLPFLGLVELNNFSIIITILWIVGISNAINLIDGLDGLASGVSTIALTSILIMAITDHRTIVIYFCIILIGSNLGFLFHNFHPAKIYMGDTGSMFLGYSIAVISILGLFKNVTLFSFVIPIIVLAVPIFDTLFSMLRRFINKEGIMMPDKKHIHYQLLAAGFSHRNTVLLLYGLSGIFGLLAILFSNASIGFSLIITFVFLVLLHIFAEIVGVVSKGRRPLLRLSKTVYKKVKESSRSYK
ncbi:glycosyltransferase family 4 protein [Aquibacillus rhizosphaerae]|uniref:MraY family glycosyltransferase n=1 Tax=Aquibacillus rhizosphaerae TaxID=3051431 RepID=A0ABT7L2Q3_9BACI|nr:MraY family glycosyltransferase [Aquibacillus sp. LR5S19]MDL4838881.1 MraY family glycosyltransferase [Aquibacillus sp. LR5S19]